ncbi:MAG: NAD-dependent epimerase/dehydratase family protein [Promethearchaeota archaeon]
MKNILITGATGLVGSHIVEYLVKSKKLGILDPKNIICLVRNPTKKRTAFLRKLNVRIVEGDLSDSERLLRIFNNHNIYYVFHAAANCDPSASCKSIIKANIFGTRNILNAFINSDAKYFVFCSSITVYNLKAAKKINHFPKSPPLKIDENFPMGSLKNDNPYSISKRKNEILIKEYSKKYKNKMFIITRLGVIVGARDRLIIPAFVKFMSLWFIPKLIASGRDYMAITSPIDVARAQVFLIEKAEKGNIRSGDIFNIVAKPITYYEIFTTVAIYFKLLPPVMSFPMWMFNLMKPILEWIRKMFKDFEFVQKALSESALEFIGNSYVFDSSKLEKLGFKFKISGTQTILLGLNDLYPDAKIKEPYIIYAWKKQIYKYLDQWPQLQSKLKIQTEKKL